MRVHAAAATAALLLVTLTACASDDGDPDEKSATKTPASTPKEPNGDDGAETLKFGEPAQTIGENGTGVLQITPDSIVYVKRNGTDTAENGVFAVVTLKDKAMTAAAADEVAPISGGGWKWIAPDGETIDAGGGESYNVVVDKYNNEDPVQPGTYQRRLRAFDLTPAQAKGGTLIYVDGEETAHLWKVPAVDSGPHVTELKKQLAQ
ncbi:hypothetical protein [Streptomyces luteocolor]|uniref:hypothetical protein n=1 Tax=Streptomyces luteocolor TaxID=285500 RepID=UPI000853CB8D|nr:hypothetical protein [Streptomyces luteocolor]